ncbi:MAG: alanine--glyoxylate aminotransferase family protein, partial [Bryobacteraceae bacterium]
APISMFYALREALRIIDEEGLENRFRRHRNNHLAFVSGIEAMGLQMHVARPQHRLWTLNTPRVPEGISDVALRRRLLEEHGIEVLGGFGPLAGKVLRVGLMGASSTRENVLLLLEGLESALRAESFPVPASGREAAERCYADLDAAS